jgi:thymidylate synthase ThyX
MTIKAEIILDSIGPNGVRLTTFSLTYPRVIHAEFMTHRIFSRNASSSRAIPWTRMRQWIIDDPYIPIHWGKNQKGMQAIEELTDMDKEAARVIWLNARDSAIVHADCLSGVGIHKQIVNRLVENFGHINVVMSTTEIANFIKLRIHRAAMPEMQALAVTMARALRDSRPARMAAGEWHLPYLSQTEQLQVFKASLPIHEAIGLSTARCGRVSYKTFDGQDPSRPHDLQRYKELIESDPMHATPVEHQAMACSDPGVRSGNFTGWIQHRKGLANERARPDFDWRARLVEWDGVDYIV